MTELEKIEYTKTFIDKMSGGINPLDGSAIPDGDLLKNMRISRCMSYVSGILQGICDYLRDQKPTRKRGHRNIPFAITPEQLRGYEFDDEPLTLSQMVAKINELIDLDAVGRLNTRSLSEWLIRSDLLAVTTTSNGRERKMPTQKGEACGIFPETRTGYSGQSYVAVLYNADAQRFILNHIGEVAEINNARLQIKAAPDGGFEYRTMHWTPEHNKKLIEMFGDGFPISDIAVALKMPENKIRARLIKFGLIDKTML